MKAATLVDILRTEAEVWHDRGDSLPIGEDAVPYGVAEAFRGLADAIEYTVEADL